MLEYTIITILLLTLGGTYWRKRVWKKRAKAGYLGFWGMIDGWRNPAEIEQKMFTITDGKTGNTRYFDRWPEIIDDK